MITERIKRLGPDIDPRWDADRVEASLGALHRRVRRRRALLAAAAAVALAGGALLAAGRRADPAVRPGDLPAPIAAAAPADAGVPQRATASAATSADAALPQLVTARAVATPLSPDAIVYASDDRSDVVAMRVERGTVRFTVESDPARPFRVDAGPVLVEVLGTEFTIARGSDHTTVSVSHGVVRAHWQGGETTLRAGESGSFPPDEAPAAAASRRPAPAPPATAPPPREADDVDGLLAAADRAQLEGRLDDALALIERALAQPPDPTHEAAAAFTLGHVRGRRGEHDLAAKAFARARAADPDGALAEDALAREVEAWARAGEAARAADAARLYLERYPGGRRSRMVRRLGLEE